MTVSSFSSFAELDGFVAALEERVQVAIAYPADSASPTIRCRFQQKRLLALSEDIQAASTARERDQRFKALALAISTALTEMELPAGILNTEGALPIRLYLRQRGTASPYAARSWNWQPTDVLSSSPEESDTDLSAGDASQEPEASAGALVLLSSLPDPTDTLLDGAAPPANQTVRPSALWQRWQALREASKDWPWRSITGLVVVGLVVGGIAYSVSRPCLVGRCDRRQTASDLSQAARDQLQSKPTVAEINSAHADLQKAVRLLAGVPPWSPHYDTVQAELGRYRGQLADLEWIMAAQKSAAAAAEKAQDPPHPVPLWVEVRLLWKKALIDLQRVPEDSAFAELAQQKLTEYEANHAAIGQRLSVEEQAEANLNKALQAGQLAGTRMQGASNLSEWLLAEREWQQAVNALDQIPQGTLAYGEARSLLEDHRTQLIQARTRVNLEKAGDRAYQAGLKNAAEAQAAERDTQWALAVDKWRRAHSQMRQVPENTALYTEAQNQLTAYQASLERAQNKLKQAAALETLESDLEALCPAAEGICTFSYNTQQIELILAEPYDSTIRQSISPPSTQNRLNQATPVVEQTHRLVQKIMRLGNQAQLPIYVYDIDRRFIARYQPEYGGFMKEP